MSIRSFRDWMAEDPRRHETGWLILGKGPSFAHLSELDSGGLLRFGLNHVVRETSVDVFHCIDIEVIEHCGEAILKNAGVAVLPWAPHVRRRLVPFSSYEEFVPSGLSLADYLERYPVLRTLAAEGRLLWYNLRTASRRLRRPEAPVTPARGFSASAATALLASCGVKRIRTLGVDGGGSYAANFGDLAGKTLLSAGQPSFNSQFTAIAALIRTHDLDLGPLNHPMPARIIITAGPTEQVPARVLAHKLHRCASLSLDITFAPPAPDTEAIKTGIGTGRTINVDACCLIQGDLRDLWSLPPSTGEHKAGGLPACETGTESKLRLLPEETTLVTSGQSGQSGPTVDGIPWFAALPNAWRPGVAGETIGSLVTCWPEGTLQPWRDTDALDIRRWCTALFEALEDETITRRDIEQAVHAGHVRPSLLIQVDRGLKDPALLSHRQRIEDLCNPGNTIRRMPVRRIAAAYTQHLADALSWSRWHRYGRLILEKGWKLLQGIGN